MRRAFELGGYVAALVLVAFGIAALVLALNGRNEVGDNLETEMIYRGDDMHPARSGGNDYGVSEPEQEAPVA